MALFVSEEQIIQSGGNREHLVFAHLFSHPRATADILFLKHDRSIFRQPFDSTIYVVHGSAQFSMGQTAQSLTCSAKKKKRKKKRNHIQTI